MFGVTQGLFLRRHVIPDTSKLRFGENRFSGWVPPAFRCGLGFPLLGLAAGILAGSQSRRHAPFLPVFLVNMVLSKLERIVP